MYLELHFCLRWQSWRILNVIGAFIPQATRIMTQTTFTRNQEFIGTLKAHRSGDVVDE